MLLVSLGIALRWRKRVVNQENENEQMESALADLRHGNQLAIELHDTLSNDLTLSRPSPGIIWPRQPASMVATGSACWIAANVPLRKCMASSIF